MKSLRVVVAAFAACTIALFVLAGCNKQDDKPRTDNSEQRQSKRDGT